MSDGFTYSPLFRLTLKARALMRGIKHALSHVGLVRVWSRHPTFSGQAAGFESRVLTIATPALPKQSPAGLVGCFTRPEPVTVILA